MGFFYDAISLKNARKSNMDRVSMCVHVIEGEEVGLFLMADGVGSTELGEESAKYVVDELGDWFFSQISLRQLGMSMGHIVFELNQDLLELCKEKKGATTLSALLLTKNRIFFCHVGDSRIYEAGEHLSEPWTQLTVDHVNEEGKLTDFLGKNSHLAIDFWEKPRKAGQYLLCTDGFYRNLDWEKQSAVLGTASPLNIRRKLEEVALESIQKGELDNCSALLLVIN